LHRGFPHGHQPSKKDKYNAKQDPNGSLASKKTTGPNKTSGQEDGIPLSPFISQPTAKETGPVDRPTG